MYQFLEFGKRKLKDILYKVRWLNSLGYGTYSEICEWSTREINDMIVVEKSIQQEAELKGSSGR